MGGQPSKLREELQAAQRQLSEEQSRAGSLEAELRSTQQSLATERGKREQREAELGEAARQYAQQLEAKEEHVICALKQREVLEQLRISDALLLKSVTTAMLQKPPVVRTCVTGALDELGAGAIASDSATAAGKGEEQLRDELNAALARLAVKEAHSSVLIQASRSDQRRALCSELWLNQMCDASLTLRSANLMVLGGLRMPRPQQGLLPATGLSGGVGVLRRFGAEEGSAGPWTAVGGSLLWDARERELSALRFAICGQPMPGQRVSMGFDHTGSLTGSLKSSWDAFTLHATGSVDLNTRGINRMGVEVSYDLD
uniref:Uncharacterized protein n=1 Tax=Strombidinopsis acuminata TaxID=141414 RepID=A0A7S3W6S4_9SPIT|mmetsp:Transcript_343/g.1081  ORF Transcript_343/g.1081 Transcript_343/m.1081 type:complete len:315 (+) Transcript_343:114-1058(+)|eukprot:scaffold62393_cov31-Tisochrysis_lutea.AAC.1